MLIIVRVELESNNGICLAKFRFRAGIEFLQR